MNEYIKTPSIITVSGSNGQGKSHFIKYLITSFMRSVTRVDKFDIIIVFSNTAEWNRDYDFLTEFEDDVNFRQMIFNPIIYESVLSKIMKIQKSNIQKGITRRMLIVFDDICGSIKDSKILKTVVTMNRHFNLTIIFSVQYINLAATYLREISLYDIIFELKTENSLKACFNNYFIADYNSFAEFKRSITKVLKQYHFFFADRIAGTKKIMICPK